MRIELYVSSELPQDVTEDIIIREAGKYFSAFSLYPITGIWKGKREDSWVVMLETSDRETCYAAEILAEELKKIFHQDAVLMVVTDTTTKLI